LTKFRENRINVDFVERRRGEQTTIVAVNFSSAGEIFQTVSPGASAVMSKTSLLAARAMISSCDLMLIYPDIPSEIFAFAIDVAHHFRVPVMVYPCPAERVSKDLLHKIEILAANRRDVELLTGKKVHDLDSAVACLHLLMKYGVGAAMIIVAGTGIACMMQNAEPFYAPAPRVSGVQVWENSVLLAHLANLLAGGNLLRNACFSACAEAVNIQL
jgi:ribokinase